MNKSEIQLIMEEEMRMKEEVSQANLEAFKVLSSISSFLTNCPISISWLKLEGASLSKISSLPFTKDVFSCG